jgi:cobalt-zinc-cadmium resistance protein CzcA
MIIDATIIMVEKIQAALQKDLGNRPITEVILATAKEIGPPIFFAIVIIIIVFIPIITLQEVEGKMFRPMGITVSVTMLGSLIYALVVAPVLYSILHRGKPRTQVIKDRLTIFHEGYRAILSIFLNKRILVVGLIILGLGTGVLFFAHLGTEFVPILQEGDIQVLAHLNPNISLDKAKDIAMDLEREIIKSPEVQLALSDVGYGEVSPHIHQTNYACITVGLKPMGDWTTGKTREDLENEIRDRIKGYPGITVEISLPIKHEIDHMITGASGQVVAKLFGPDLEVLKNKAAEIENSLKEVKGAADVFTDPIAGQTHLNIELNLQELARHGLDKLSVQHTIHDAIGGEILGEVFEGDKRFGIFVRYDENYRNSIESMNNLLIKKPDGSTILLSDLLKSKIIPITGFRQISRENSHRLLPVRCNITGRALLAVLIMLFSLFHSMKNVLLVMLNIPLALVGGVIALFIFGGILSIPSSIGFIALFGIALTDGLVLISRFEFLRKKGLALKDAVIEGSISKLRPVLMTTITTAFGLLPLIISTGVGSEIQRPLAIVVVGGLVSSTLLTLIVLPSLYLSFSRENDK